MVARREVEGRAATSPKLRAQECARNRALDRISASRIDDTARHIDNPDATRGSRSMRFGVAALACCVACGGNRARAGDDAHAIPRSDGSPGDAAAPTGELQVRVDWKTVAPVSRRSPGPTRCNMPRAPAVAPTTTWGIPDAFVIVEGGPPPPEARVVLADCALRPRVAAASVLVVESAVDRPARVTLVKHGTIADLATATLHPGDPRVIQLPIAGHAVAIPLDANSIYQLATEGEDPETAWIIAGPAYVTDATGQVVVAGLPIGARSAAAWIPPRGNQSGRFATGSSAIVANELAELAIDVGR